MIQDLMRKHKTFLLWAILLLVIIPFVYWGGYSGLRRYARGHDADAFPPVAAVGKVAVPQQYLRSALAEELNRRRQYQPGLTYRDLHEDGTAMEILDNLVNRTVLDMEAQETGAAFPREFLIEELKKQPRFQKDGKFDPAAWNEWLDQRGRHNWNVEYEAMQRDLQRRLVVERALASARVLESDVRREFEESFTRLRVRYVAIAPKETPTEEQIRAYFEAHPDRYQTPENMRAQFVSISLKPPRPPLVDDLVQRARAGEDFAELARQYSDGPDKDNGGDMGWRAETEITPDHLKPLFQLEPGQVSEPIEAFGGYYIFAVEEERTDPATGRREVKSRQIVLRPRLSDVETAERTRKAEEIAEKAKGAGGLRGVAEEQGLELKTTGRFSDESPTIDNVPSEDTWAFRAAASQLGLNQPSDVIEARSHLYIVEVIEVEPPAPLPFEEVRERVARDLVAEIEMSPEYRERVARIVREVSGAARSVGDILRSHPDLGLSLAETDWFTVAEYRPGQGPMWRARDVFQAVGRGAPGVFGGPVQGLDGTVYFVELIAKEPPDESVWAEKWKEQAPLIRDRLLAQARTERIQDYFRNNSLRRGLRIDQKTYDEILGLSAPEGLSGEALVEDEETKSPSDESNTPSGSSAISPPGRDDAPAAPATDPAAEEQS